MAQCREFAESTAWSSISSKLSRMIVPFEKVIMEREAGGQKPSLLPEEEEPLLAKCKELGLWALDARRWAVRTAPTVMLVIREKLWSTVTPFTTRRISNLLMLDKVATPEQKAKYMNLCARCQKSAIAISEPGAGGDPAHMRTRAIKDGDDWVINGAKFGCLTCRRPTTSSDGGDRSGKGSARRDNAFIVDKDAPVSASSRKFKCLADRAHMSW